MSQTQLTANGTSDAAGNLVIKFATINVNAEFTGVVSIPSAPASALITVNITGTNVATIGGSSQYGSLQLNSSDVLELTGTGFTADTQYQAVAVGAIVYGTAGAVIPTPTTTAILASLIGVITAEGPAPGQVLAPVTPPSGTQTQTVNIPTNTNTIIVVTMGAIPTNVSVNGVESNYQYRTGPPYLIDGGGSGTTFEVVPVVGAVDSSVDVITTTSAGGMSVAVYATNLLIPESTFYNGGTIAKSITSAGTLVAGEARILTVQIEGTTGGQIEWNGQSLLVLGTATEASLTLPPNTLLPYGQNLTAAGSFASAGVLYSLP
jgi:hypothetical protein